MRRRRIGRHFGRETKGNAPLPLANHRILVIDDNAAIHNVFRKIPGVPTSSKETFTASELAHFGDPTAGIVRLTFELSYALQGEEGVKLVSEALTAGRPWPVRRRGTENLHKD